MHHSPGRAVRRSRSERPSHRDVAAVGFRASRAGRPAPPARARSRSSTRLSILAIRSSQRFCRATSIRRSIDGRGTLVHGLSDRRREGVGVVPHRHHRAVLGIEPPDRGEVGGHHGDSHRQVLVQLGGIDVGRVRSQAVGDQPHVESLDVARHLRVRPRPEEMHVRTLGQPGDLGLDGAHEDEARLGHPRGDRRQQILIHPPVHATEVPHERPLERPEIRRQPSGRLACLLEHPEVDPEREQVNVVAEPGGAGPKHLRAGEHQVRLLEQAGLAGGDALRRRGARGEVVDAVVDGEGGSQSADQIVDQGRGEEGPDDRAYRSRRSRPRAQCPEQERAVDPAGHRRVRERQKQRRVDDEVLPLLAEAPGAAPPVANPLAEAGHVPELGRAHPGVLDEEDPVPSRRKGHRDLVMPLPEQVPVDGREADDVVMPVRGGRHAHRATPSPLALIGRHRSDGLSACGGLGRRVAALGGPWSHAPPAHEALGRRELEIEALDLSHHHLSREPGARRRAPTRCHRRGPRGIREQSRDRVRQGLRVFRGDEEPGFAVLDRLGNAADPRRDDWLPERERLQDRDRQPLGGDRRQHDHVAQGEQVHAIGPRPQDADPRRQARGGDTLTSCLESGAAPREDQRGVGEPSQDARHRLEQPPMPFHGHEVGHGHEHGGRPVQVEVGARDPGRGADPIEIEPVEDGDHLPRIDADPGTTHEVLGRAAGHGDHPIEGPVGHAMPAGEDRLPGAPDPPVVDRAEVLTANGGKPDRHPGQRARQPREHVGGPEVRVHDVARQTSHQPGELRHAPDIEDAGQRQRPQARRVPPVLVGHRALAVAGDEHLEAFRIEPLHDRSECTLGAPEVRRGDDREDPQPARKGVGHPVGWPLRAPKSSR